MKPKTLTIRQAEDATGISQWTWRMWRYKKLIASHLEGRVVVIPASEVQRMASEVLATRAHIHKPSPQELAAG